MVYKHRTKSGKIRHYQSKSAYEKSMKGMFAQDYQKKNHSTKIAKNKKKRRVKHRGVGKVSSVKKKLCDTCKGKDKELNTKGRCKECVKEFREFEQPTQNTFLNKITNDTFLHGLDIMQIENWYGVVLNEDHDARFTKIGNIGVELKTSDSEFLIFKGFEEAKDYAITEVRDEIEEFPENFNESLLQNHITMTDANIRMNASHESESSYDWEGFTNEELKHRFGKGADETKSRGHLIEDAKHEEYVRIKKELEESPLAYYVTDNAFYTKSSLMDQDWIRIDAHTAAEEAVREDGAKHYLARFDGEELATNRGKYVYRRN